MPGSLSFQLCRVRIQVRSGATCWCKSQNVRTVCFSSGRCCSVHIGIFVVFMEPKITNQCFRVLRKLHSAGHYLYLDPGVQKGKTFWFKASADTPLPLLLLLPAGDPECPQTADVKGCRRVVQLWNLICTCKPSTVVIQQEFMNRYSPTFNHKTKVWLYGWGGWEDLGAWGCIFIMISV